ncbi:hypothetical protein ACIP5Y_31905 [Nocardia sp. NPDC088792]|uniref:globin domain-containing protein n=1 Tax=Nocardia sp. NPDC088792 TaxID=3364332 RepID=UPI003829026A
MCPAIHQGRGITMHHFNSVAGHLTGALSDGRSTTHLVDEIIGVIASLSADITSDNAKADA